MPKKNREIPDEKQESATLIECGENLPDKPYVDGSWELLQGLDSDEEVEELKAFALDAANQRNRRRS